MLEKSGQELRLLESVVKEKDNLIEELHTKELKELKNYLDSVDVKPQKIKGA